MFKKDKHVSFHQFPSDSTVAEKWVQLLQEKKLVAPDFKFTASNRVCSKHFSNGCYEQLAGTEKRRRLQKSAMPSLFLEGFSSEDLVGRPTDQRKRKQPGITDRWSVNTLENIKLALINIECVVYSCSSCRYYKLTASFVDTIAYYDGIIAEPIKFDIITRVINLSLDIDFNT